MLFVSANYSLLYTLTHLSMCVYVCLVGFFSVSVPIVSCVGKLSGSRMQESSKCISANERAAGGPSPILQPRIKLSLPRVFLGSSLPYIPHGQLWQQQSRGASWASCCSKHTDTRGV